MLCSRVTVVDCPYWSWQVPLLSLSSRGSQYRFTKRQAANTQKEDDKYLERLDKGRGVQAVYCDQRFDIFS